MTDPLAALNARLAALGWPPLAIYTAGYQGSDRR